MRRCCRCRPVLEGMETRVLLSTAASKLSRLVSHSKALHPAYFIQNPAEEVFSRQSGAATITIARANRAGAGSVEIIASANPNAPSTSAQPGVQFQAINQTITFEPGQATQSVTIPLIPGQDGPDSATILVQLKPTGSSGLTAFENVTIVKRADVAEPGVSTARLLTRKSQIIGVNVGFNEPMDAGSISDARRYVLVDTHKNGVMDWVASLAFRSRSQGNMGFRSGSYDPASQSLTLLLPKPVKNLGRYQFGAVWGENRGKYPPPTDASGNALPRFTLSLNGNGAITRT